MRLLILRNLGSNLPQYTEGQVVDCDESTGGDLVRRGLAEPLAIQGVAKSPQIAEPKPVEMKAIQPAPELAPAKQTPQQFNKGK